MRVARQFLLDLFDGIHHRCVIFPPEGVADARKAETCPLSHQKHANLPGLTDSSSTAAAAHVIAAHSEHLRHLVDDLLRGDLHALATGIKHGSNRFHRHWQPSDGGESDSPRQCTFQLPNIGRETSGDVLNEIPGQGHPLLFRFLLKDGHPCFQIRCLYVGNQPHGKSGDQTLLKPGDLTGRPIAGNHDLTACFMERVEGVEELFLGVFLALDELDVIHQDQISSPISVTERLHSVSADRQD